MTDEKLTVHFTLHECRCRCGCGIERQYIPQLKNYCLNLELLRSRINANPDYYNYRTLRDDGTLAEIPLIIERAISCPAHNHRVGGKPESQHLSVTPTGREYEGAGDIHTGGRIPLESLHREVTRLFTGSIMYPRRGIVHADMRTGGNYCAIDNTVNHSIT